MSNVLADSRIDSNVVESCRGETALHIAAREGGKEAEILLADPRIDPNNAD